MNALPFVPKRGNSSPKDEEEISKDQSLSPILTVPNGLTIKCNPRIWQSISARSTDTDSNNLPLKPKSLFTLPVVIIFSNFFYLIGYLSSQFQAESKVNIQPAIRQACSTPNVQRINSTAFRTDSSRERRPSSVKFELKQSRSHFNTLIDEDSAGDEPSIQFNENNTVR